MGQVMDSSHSTICALTSGELSKDMGGVVAMNTVSVADLKWVLNSGNYEILGKSVNEFVEWRAGVANTNIDQMLRHERLRRINVIAVKETDSLHMLAHRLLQSKVQRIFLSSEEIGRIIGIVSSRDIVLEVLSE